MEVLGAVLCGGAGRRLGQPKASALLAGRPLAWYPLQALEKAGIERVMVTRRDAPAPDLGVPVLYDDDETRHPLAGILRALDHANGRPVLAIATDLPFLTAAFLQQIAAIDAPVAIPRTDRGLHPLCARYSPATIPDLEQALAAEAPLRSAVRALHPHIVDVEDQALLTNINDAADLAAAEASLRPTPPPPSSRSAPPP